jgi:hypothetical protein
MVMERVLSLPKTLSVDLARPGGNATGFLLFEYGLSGKWVELLKEIAPCVTLSLLKINVTAWCDRGMQLSSSTLIAMV